MQFCHFPIHRTGGDLATVGSFYNTVAISHATTWIDQRPEVPSLYRPRTAKLSLPYLFGFAE
jgi:hypothetical protein